MALVVETGAGLANADSYVSVADAVTYATDHGLAFSASPDVGNEAALRRATAAIDAMYGARFPGYKTNLRSQALQWPRGQAYDREDNLISSTEIPIEVVRATIEAAVRELAAAGSMMPDLERGGAIESISAGSVSIKYASSAEARTTYTVIDGILSGILTGGNGGGLFGRAVRS